MSGVRPRSLAACILVALVPVALAAACGGEGTPTTTSAPAVAPTAASKDDVALTVDGKAVSQITKADFPPGQESRTLADLMGGAGVTDPGQVTVHGQNGNWVFTQPTALARASLRLEPDGKLTLTGDQSLDIGQVVRVEVSSKELETSAAASGVAVFVNGQLVRTITIAELKAMMQITTGEQVGPSLNTVLQVAGVQQFESVMLDGLAAGRSGLKSITLTAEQVGSGALLDFTNKNTVKLYAPGVPREQWVLDVTKITVTGAE